MCTTDPVTWGYIFTALSTATTVYSIDQQNQTTKKVARNNQIMAEYAAQDAERRGDREAAEARRRAQSLSGSQRSVMAAKGLDLSVGTAAEIQDQTDFFAENDQITARENSRKDAWAARQSGNAARAQGDAEARQGNLQMFSTVLGAGGMVADRWGNYSKPKRFAGNDARFYYGTGTSGG